MGTNYYAHKNVCDCCGVAKEVIHIGKSSGGWTFGLHIHPERGIYSLEDWSYFLSSTDGCQIYDEYGNELYIYQLAALITKRKGSKKWEDRDWENSVFYNSEQQFHDENHSMRGPNNLFRHKIGYGCVGHGNGTYDLFDCDFS